jgi:hypothetical protein
MGTEITAENARMYEEDVRYGAAVSEAVGYKLGGLMNYIADKFSYYDFGVVGANYDTLSAYPYTFSNQQEVIDLDATIYRIEVTNDVAGTSGTTEFRIEKQVGGVGGWTNIFSVNCSILHSASDALAFTTEDAAPTGVTLPVVSTAGILKGDRLRFVLVSAAAGASNLKVKVVTR